MQSSEPQASRPAGLPKSASVAAGSRSLTFYDGRNRDMTLTDKQFNAALEMFQEFGPRRRIPVQERWAEAFPDATAEDFGAWQVACREIEDYAYGVAEQVRDERLDEHTAVRQISERFPRLSRERVEHTFSQAMYFSIK